MTHAAVTFDSIASGMIAHIPGCPQYNVVEAVKKVAIEGCERTLVYLLDTDFFYTPDTPLAFPDIVKHIVTLDQSDPVPLVIITFDDVRIGGTTQVLNKIKYVEAVRRYGTYAAADESTYVRPEGITYYGVREPGSQLLRENKYTFHLFPYPAQQVRVDCDIILKPSLNSVGIPDFVYSKLSDVIFHGALQRLLTMQEKTWTDLELASYHAKQYIFHLNRVKANTRLSRSVTGSIRVQPVAFA